MTQPDAYDRIIASVDRIVGDLTELLYEVRSLKLDAAAKANDSTPLGRDRYVRPSGERREQAVRCLRCPSQTWALDGLCDPCYVEHGAVAS